jgi:hypothetical protein
VDVSFSHYADYQPNYRKEAAEDGWKQLQAWFKKYGVVYSRLNRPPQQTAKEKSP